MHKEDIRLNLLEVFLNLFQFSILIKVAQLEEGLDGLGVLLSVKFPDIAEVVFDLIGKDVSKKSVVHDEIIQFSDSDILWRE